MGWLPWTPEHGTTVPGLPPVIGHRGAAARAPENTLEGFAVAAALGVRWVEIDVMLTADGVPVLIHDETLERTTTGRGRVAAHTLAEIEALDAGGWFGPDFAGARVPGLEATLRALRDLGLGLNLEVKPAAGHDVATARAAVSVLKRCWPANAPPVLVSSFSRTALAVAAELAPDLPRGLLAGSLPPDWRHALTMLRCTSLHLDDTRLRPGELAMLVGLRVPTLLYTVNDPSRARQLLETGAAAVFTDMPDAILAALTQ